jgi:opacity protein-like surface antigen
MKLKVISTVALVGLACTSAAWAGERMVSHERESKNYVAPSTPECFRDQELQIDLFGEYAATDHNQSRLLGDHAWGGGVGVNYFFNRYVGVGLEGNWLDRRSGRGSLGTAGANLFLRLPCTHSCWAGYIYGGPDVVFGRRGDNEEGASTRVGGGHAGLGIEYRVTHNVGIFLDGRYTIVQNSGNDFGTIRSGLRFAF